MTTASFEWTPKRIKALRSKVRMTQAAFAKQIGVSRLTIANWETEFKSPSLNHQAHLDKIAGDNGITRSMLDSHTSNQRHPDRPRRKIQRGS